MRFELHCHSLRSDGTDPPRVVAERAAAAGVEVLCLTDHDTWDGWSDTLGVAPGVRVLRGLELSCAERGRTVHVLVYGLVDGPGLEAFDAELVRQQQARRVRVLEICARFAERFRIAIDSERVFELARGATPGRPHIAAALVEAKVVRSVREAFDRFLHDGGPADVPSAKLDVATGVALARAAGARASLAHPHSMGHPMHVRALFQRLRGEGLEGIEALYGGYATRERTAWLAIADELDLVVTAGSDYHGAKVVPDIPVPAGIDVPEPRAARLRDWLGV